MGLQCHDFYAPLLVRTSVWESLGLERCEKGNPGKQLPQKCTLYSQ